MVTVSTEVDCLDVVDYCGFSGCFVEFGEWEGKRTVGALFVW